ncbi:MAG: hypothetical protein ACREMN_04780, partial [Gemmatimonadales bacterium]
PDSIEHQPMDPGDLFRGQDPRPRDAFGNRGSGAGRGAGFRLNVGVSFSRSRADTSRAQRNRAGQRVITLESSFSPTRNWTARWYTSYDLGTGQFPQHRVSFERDLDRWRASFHFYQSANGNFSFSFNISLIDQPDIKFDYDQSTFVRP